MYRALWIVLLLLLQFGLACGSTNQSSTERQGVEISGDRIEIVDPHLVSHLSAYELINQNRRQWLSREGPKSINAPTPIKVYIDSKASEQSISVLRSIPADQISYVEHFEALEAQSEFGLGNTSGAIFVHTRASGQLQK